MNDAQPVPSRHRFSAFDAHGELGPIVNCVCRHVPQGELAMSVEGSAHSPVHTLAQGTLPEQPHSTSSQPRSLA
jgi:hypothetical protein